MDYFKKYFPIILFGTFLAAIFLPFYRDGKMISGWEGGYFLDFPLMLKNYGYSWSNWGTGIFATSLNFGYVFHLSLLQRFILNERLVNFAMIYLLYFLPFIAIYLLSRELKVKSWISLLIAFFYIANPFMSNFMKSINQWNMLAAYILPVFFLIILKFYEDNWKLFFFFGIHSLFFAFTNANPPTMVLYQIAIMFFVILISLYKEQEIDIRLILRKYFWVISSFILFNFWWIINWFYIFPDARQGYSKEFAISWLRGSQEFIPAFWRTLNLTSLLQYPINPEYDYFARHYSYFFTPMLLSIPILIVIYFLFRKRLGEKYHLILGLMLVIIGFLSKGVNGLFGSVYEFMIMHIPFFSIFKSAAEKWGTLFIFLLTLYLIFIFRELKKDRLYLLIVALLMIYVLYGAVPFITGNFLPDYKFNDVVIGSKNFLDKPEYKELKNKLNSDPEQYRVLSLPGSWNYQVALQIQGNRFYTGNDPILSNTNKPFLAPYSGSWNQRFGVLYDKISHPDYLKLLGLYNIKKIVINQDMYPWFGFREKESIPELEEIFSPLSLSLKNEVINLYDVGDYFLPRFYVPPQIIYSPESTQYELPELISLNDVSKRPALFISPYEKIKEEDKFENDLVKDNASQIILAGELQSAIDEGKLRAGIRGMNPGGVLFPYARWKPGGLIYPYILKKEEKTKNQFLNQPEELLPQNLFFAGKRVFEIQKWDRSLSDKEFLDVLERYEGEMDEVIENLEKIRMTGKNAFLLLAKIEVSFEAFSKRLLDVVEGDFGKKSQRLKAAEEATERIDKRLKAVLKHYSQARYYFEIPEEGEYEVLLEKKEGISDWKIENITPKKEERFTLGVTGEPVLPAGRQKEKAWLSFGRQKFNAQDYILVLNQTPTPNLLNEDWNVLESNVETGEVIRLFSKRSTPAAWQEIKNWEPETAYKLSFKYKTPVGRLKLSLIEEKERIDTTWFDKGVEDKLPDKTNILLEEELISENPSEWEEYSIVVYSGRNTKKAKLFISAESEEEKLSEVEFKEATLTKIIEPKMVLRKYKSQSDSNIPQITFQKINPTKYVLEISNASQPYFLVFSESFHRGWRAWITDGTEESEGTEKIIASYFGEEIKEKSPKDIFLTKDIFETWREKALPDDRHLLMNGYANSWYITPEDAENQVNYQIIIEYWPQRLFYFGVGVTLATMIGSLGLAALKYAKKS
ncbi:hypothetical protein COU95_00055 [Candidatus Shapirobacteria bacterium CG10_big_fil_rev_8_21_14_0_10_40_9]|uniref:Uncharacterized protein n=1 Tax=Candidatus Shapirobacteria bacterium CG10_big_fil_rev_8_21_14_0_10_40_9 TaxID=1974888 RepID=A0A2M8L4K0_9BACT|nr:MAG: hypothetical protein COU95_00055 [Candidatus Shapirobacteria bacterium CG10_big_fil_rev_8_21_14_0_10_40_9]